MPLRPCVEAPKDAFGKRWVTELVYLTSLLNSQGLMSDGQGAEQWAEGWKGPRLEYTGFRTRDPVVSSRPSAPRCWEKVYNHIRHRKGGYRAVTQGVERTQITPKFSSIPLARAAGSPNQATIWIVYLNWVAFRFHPHCYFISLCLGSNKKTKWVGSGSPLTNLRFLGNDYSFLLFIGCPQLASATSRAAVTDNMTAALQHSISGLRDSLEGDRV